MESGQQEENSRLFMDDINTTTETIVQSKYLLTALVEKLDWAKLTAKPAKCRCLILNKGEVSKRTLDIKGQPMTRLSEKPIKYLGKEYNDTLSDREQVEATMASAKEYLKKVDKDKLPGRYKSWILQHMILLKIMWPIMIYDFPASKVEEIERLFTRYLKKWLGLPRSLNVNALYSSTAKLQLPFSAVTEEARVAKARKLVTLQTSTDKCISGANISVEAGRKWNISSEVEEARSRLRMQDITGTANQGRLGLGMQHNPVYATSSEKEKRKLITEKIRTKDEEVRRIRMGELGSQGRSNAWEVPERKLSSRDIINTSEAALKFLVRSVYELLPTPSNKNTWFRTEEFKCDLCQGEGTLNHIFSGCPVALAQGRYRWRHDKVLREIAKHVEKRRVEAKKPVFEKPRHIQFVKEGHRRWVDREQEKPAKRSYLSEATDWELRVDLEKRLKFPEFIATTNLRPDMLLISETQRHLGMIELTVPGEERIEVSHELKLNRYAALVEEARRKGWKTKLWAVEVGVRGFPASSMALFLGEIGISGGERTRILRKIGEQAERGSNTIWNMSRVKKWGKAE